jgi:hypothetical protein
MRFAEICANVKSSGIANSNEELGAGSAKSRRRPDPQASRFLRKGGAE